MSKVMVEREDFTHEFQQWGNRVATLESDVSNLVRSVERIGESVDRLNSRMVAGKSTNWGALAAWSTVLVSVIGGLGYLAIVPLRAGVERNNMRAEMLSQEMFGQVKLGTHQRSMLNSDSIAALEVAFRDHEKASGHSAANVRLDELESEVSKLFDYHNISVQQRAGTDERLKNVEQVVKWGAGPGYGSSKPSN